MTRTGLLIAPCLCIAWMACSSSRHGMGDYKVALVPSRAGQHGIFSMNSDTSGGKLLTSDPSAQLRTFSWSPDGSKIAFFAFRAGDADIRASYRMPLHYPLYTMDATGGNQKRLLHFPVSSFQWSPSGREILFVSAYEDPAHDDPAVVRGKKSPMSAIYLLDLKTGEQRRVTSFGQNCSGAWSPDGTQLALSFGAQDESDIYTASLDGRHTRRITDSQAVYVRPAYSPDGRSLAYVSVAPQPGVYVVDAAGTGPRRVSDTSVFEVTWSPDGRSLLLQSAAGISLTDVAGGKSINLTPGVGRPLDAVFTPDGREVMFRSNHEGDWQLYAVDLGGANLRRVTGSLSASAFCLSPLLSKK